MKKYILSVVFILLFYGFSFAEIPYKEVVLRIYNIPYNKYTYNCLWKAEMYCNFIASKGVTAKVVIGRYGNEKFYRHAWVRYFDGKNWRIVDLTEKPFTWGFKEKYYWWLKEE
jgi:hypothetical protein